MTLGLSYFLLCAVAKLFTNYAHGLDWFWATPLVLLWQDACLGILLGMLEQLSKRTAQVCYLVLALHLVACMPLLMFMATPLTGPLLNAAGGTLGDSFAHCLTCGILAPTVFVLVLAAILPKFLPPLRPSLAFVAAAVLMILVGWGLTPQIEAHGLQRNVAVALVGSYLPRSVHSSSISDSEISRLCSSMPRRGSAAGFNLLVITLESTGSRFLRPYNAEVDPMPRLTDLAREGWLIENAYAAYPESIKGLLAVLTSRLPKSGLKENEFSKVASPSLATVLATAGYETALFHSGRFMYLGMDAVVQGSGFSVVEDAGVIGGERESSFGVDDKQTVGRLLRWVDQRSVSRPFYIHYLPISGHHPYDAPAGPWSQSDDKSRYLNALHYSDQLLGELVDGLSARGLLEKTLVVIYGDHGEAFGEHPGNYGHTLFLYEENVRVPLMFWAPRIIAPGRCERIASLVDVAPTLCDLLAIDAPASFEGLSLLKPQTRPALFITDYSLHLTGIREANWKYIYESESGYSRLFDLRNDPHETTNVAAANQERVIHYLGQFLRWNGRKEHLSLRTDP